MNPLYSNNGKIDLLINQIRHDPHYNYDGNLANSPIKVTPIKAVKLA